MEQRNHFFHFTKNVGKIVFQLICCSDYTELESMRLSLELPGLLLAGDRTNLTPVRQAAKLLNIKTTVVSTTEEALASYRQSGQTLVIVDTKPSINFDPHNIAK